MQNDFTNTSCKISFGLDNGLLVFVVVVSSRDQPCEPLLPITNPTVESDGARHTGSTVWLGVWVKREKRSQSLRGARPHTVGYVGGCAPIQWAI